MESLKIEVNSINAGEAIDLLVTLGHKPLSTKRGLMIEVDHGYTYIVDNGNGLFTTKSHYDVKEITLPELRDMVVLKRNDVNDATHACESKHHRCGYLSSDGVEYLWFYGENKWVEAKKSFNEYGLKPIEKTIKEYLVKTKEGEYHYINDSYDTCPAYVEKIEIPEGATHYAIDSNLGIKKNYFFRCPDDAVWADSQWMRASFSVARQTVLWQRATHPEELPFIDDDPKSLNDQYAEIEQVRQQTIEATLAERQGQYGCYEDVAYITQEILKALRISGYDRMPATHKESMHMIASKMARLVCGDFNSIDGWHDIAGYATLIENLLKD